MHILIVEDERALCDTIACSLRRLAYSVDCCYDGQSAAEMLAVERFDLVVLDLNLPGEDGMTVLRTLRERDRDTKVLILSARCEVADKVAGLDAGANDYLTKPFHLDGARGAHPQPDAAPLYAERRGPDLRRAVV